MSDDTEVFEAHRPTLLALAYRMLGDMARAEDVVQDAWVRWQRSVTDVEAPKAFLITTVARLCLDELGSARERHEETRGDRLPEPVDRVPAAPQAGAGERGGRASGVRYRSARYVLAARPFGAHVERRPRGGRVVGRPPALGGIRFRGRRQDPPSVLPE
jgi:DNA-directed RNA polymerase specialized sigma24 family protein